MRNNLTCHLLTIINPIRYKIPLQSKCLETFFSTTIYKDNNNSSFGNFCITMNNLNVLFMSKECCNTTGKSAMYQKSSSTLASHRAREYDKIGNPKLTVFPELAILLISTEAFLSRNAVNTNASASLVWYPYT